jgi:hypothetical protein
MRSGECGETMDQSKIRVMGARCSRSHQMGWPDRELAGIYGEAIGGRQTAAYTDTDIYILPDLQWPN